MTIFRYFVICQERHVLPFREPIDELVLMLVDPSHQIVRYAYVNEYDLSTLGDVTLKTSSKWSFVEDLI